jgi:hypothetical protein
MLRLGERRLFNLKFSIASFAAAQDFGGNPAVNETRRSIRFR